MFPELRCSCIHLYRRGYVIRKVRVQLYGQLQTVPREQVVRLSEFYVTHSALSKAIGRFAAAVPARNGVISCESVVSVKATVTREPVARAAAPGMQVRRVGSENGKKAT